MAEVTVSINNRSYIVGCGDGEEDRLKELAAHVDRHVRDLAEQVGDGADPARLMMMASLMVADELSDTLTHLREVEGELNNLKKNAEGERSKAVDIQEKARKAVEAAVQRIETIAGRLATP